MATVYGVLADLVMVLHLAFVGFVVAGGFWLPGRPWLVRWHLPAIAWGATVEFLGWPCPLTPLEKWLRFQAGEAGYEGGFLSHYLFSLLYPSGLTRGQQAALGLLVVAVNLFWYLRFWRRRRHTRR